MSVNPNPPVAEPVATESTPATVLSEADTAGLSPEVVQALSAAFPTAAPTETTAPTAAPVADEAAPEAALEVDAEGDSDEPEPAEAETPAETGETRLSRRQKAEQARQAEIDAAVARALAADEARKASEAALAQRQAADAQLASTVAQIIGSPEDENALIDAVASGDFEAADKLKTLRANRAQAGQIAQYMRQQAYAELLPVIYETKTYEGVDAAVIDGANSLKQVIEHVRDASRAAEAAKWAAKEAEWADRLERQKADYESRLGRAAAEVLPTTETGGRAVGAPSPITEADLQRMLDNGDWQAYQKLKQQKALVR